MMDDRRPHGRQTGEGAGAVARTEGDFDQQVATRAAWLYFMEGRTQGEIADHLGMNRVRINRILAAARESGLVQIRINGRLLACVELERALIDTFGVREAFVVPSPIDPGATRKVVALQAGAVLSDRLTGDMVLAVGWGRTLRTSLQAMEPRSLPGLEVVSLIGGLTRGSVMNSTETALRLADMFGATCSYIAAPAFADTEETRDILMRQGMILDALAGARKADIAYVSVGALDPDCSMLRLGLITPEDYASLDAAGAVGDLMGYWIDAEGELVDHPLNRRVMALPPEDLRSIPSVILVTGGGRTDRAIRAALRRGLFHTIVTDEATAARVCGGAVEARWRERGGGLGG